MTCHVCHASYKHVYICACLIICILSPRDRQSSTSHWVQPSHTNLPNAATMVFVTAQEAFAHVESALLALHVNTKTVHAIVLMANRAVDKAGVIPLQRYILYMDLRMEIERTCLHIRVHGMHLSFMSVCALRRLLLDSLAIQSIRLLVPSKYIHINRYICMNVSYKYIYIRSSFSFIYTYIYIIESN